MQITDITLNKNQVHLFYTQYFHYYNTLSQQWQNKFVLRALKFMQQKNIVGAEGFEVNNQVKALIAASAVQLTLGLETWDYDYFLEIIIHPRIYTNKATNLKYKGETNLNGHIRLSWLSFINGYKNLNDNVNLGIHEFAHALRFNGIRGNEQDYYLRYFFTKWLSTAYEAYYHLKRGRQSIFRPYGGANINEFISVCFEHYFESPEQIKAHYPHLYYNTAVLLNQYTQNNKTFGDVREDMLKEKNKLMRLVYNQKLKQNLNSGASLTLVFITAVLFLLTAIKTGVFSGPSLILVIITAFFYLRFERNFLTLHVFSNQMTIKKGFALFKKGRTKTILLAQIVNVHYAVNTNNTELVLIYYCFETKHFYEETMECLSDEFTNFTSEFKANKIAIHKKR